MRRVEGRIVFSPSDLNDALACEHRIALARRALLRGDEPLEPDATLEVIAQKGREHERRALLRLAEQGVGIVRIPEGDGSLGALRDAVAQTRRAMERGAAAISQAAFLEDGWTGRADLLLRVETPSALGAWSYDVADAKLAVREKASFLVQLCTYARFVASIQGRLPDSVRALLGDGRETVYDPRRYVAYVDAARERLTAGFAAYDPERVPDKIAACAGCAWSATCEQRRRGVDHLQLVAGMRRSQAARLRADGIPTLTALALARADAKPRGVAESTFLALRRQAALQLEQRTRGVPRYELLAPQPAAGFALLPQPAPGDVYFDMEGDPLYEAGAGLEYLFGAYVEGAARPYVPFWGETREGERAAFEAFVDWLVAHRAAHPGAHVYHYAPYEKSALRRLAMRHGTREREVDELLRGEVLVDLYAIVRGALAQSQESYSIKKLEAFYGFVRSADVRKGDDSIVAFERYLLDADPSRRDDIITYNEEDCVSTHRLHQWLLRLHGEAQAAFGATLPFRPQRDPGLPTPDELAAQEELDALQRALLDGALPGAPRRLLAHLLAYHRREDKPVWWALFDRFEREGSYDAVEDDGDALGGLTLCLDVAPEPAGGRSKKQIFTYRFPRQQHKLGTKSPLDPATRAGAGEIVELDDDACIVRLKRNPGDPHPRTLVPGGPLRTQAQKGALRRLAEAVLDGTAAQRYAAAWGMLRADAPRVRGVLPGRRMQPELRDGAEAIDPHDVAALASALDRSSLVVQGPPGTGKTYTGARIIARLLAEGKRVGVTATGHHAIHNLLHEVEKVVAADGASFRGVKKCDGKREETRFVSRLPVSFIESREANEPFADVQLVAGTAWLFTREDLAPVDVLVIDEAGQVALADALAMATNASSVVLLGDPLQLTHVSLAQHPEGAGASVLEHLLAGHDTVPEDRGVFLDRSFRMHPTLCGFISEMVYEGRLGAAASCAFQRIDAPGFSGAGLRYVPVAHEGNVQSSPEEADAVAALIDGLVGGTFTGRDGTRRPLTLGDVLVVSPYNAQVALLRRTLRGRFGGDVRVGTVDKFQGQEAPVVLYSLAASSAEDAPRGADFLLEENRFNVAVSRGRALAVLVCSPRLLETRCEAVGQLRAAAAFCAFAALAGSGDAVWGQAGAAGAASGNGEHAVDAREAIVLTDGESERADLGDGHVHDL